MGRTKGSKNKKQKVTYYSGYFLMDSGLKVEFDIPEYNADEDLKALHDNCDFRYEDNDMIWLGESDDVFIRAKKVVGLRIDSYEAVE